MMRFACLCGYREEADRTPLCRNCKAPMYAYAQPAFQPIRINAVPAPVAAKRCRA